jgi:hypothetical protein
VPPKLDKSPVSPATEDKRATEAARASSSDDKMRALRQYRRARGLCNKCAEKWSYGHKCAATLQLHAILELWELFPDNGPIYDDSRCSDTEVADQLCVCLSEATLQGIESSMSMRFWGSIQGRDILILDSGSSSTFISSALAALLSGVSPLDKSVFVKVASGQKILCVSQIQQVVWHIQDFQFCSDLQVLSLDHFDMILGYNWCSRSAP